MGTARCSQKPGGPEGLSPALSLQLAFFHVRGDDKPAVLLHLLRSVVKPQDQTVVFVATKHHTEYLKEVSVWGLDGHFRDSVPWGSFPWAGGAFPCGFCALFSCLQLLTSQGICCTHIYSSLDQTARKINIAKFAHGKCQVLLVTDVAARGLDIPMLDNVINYSFPAKSKLFLHRVGRCHPGVPQGDGDREGVSGLTLGVLEHQWVPVPGRGLMLALVSHPPPPHPARSCGPCWPQWHCLLTGGS